MYMEKCSENVETSVGDEATSLEDDGAGGKVVRLVSHREKTSGTQKFRKVR